MNTNNRLLFHCIVWLGVCWCLAPFLWQIITSLKSDQQIMHTPTVFIPTTPQLDHYKTLFERKPFARYLWNSLLVSTVSTLLCLSVSAMGAYSLARLKIRGSAVLSLLLITISLFPPIIFFFPLYELVRKLSLMNHPLALILAYVAFNLPLSIFILTAFFRGISSELEDAAKVDGFTRWQIFTRLILPISAPALATTGILIFISCWNEFLFALTFMTDDRAKTITAGVASLSGGSIYELPWGPIAAAVVVSTIPLVILVMIFQRRIIQGLTAGAVKG